MFPFAIFDVAQKTLCIAVFLFLFFNVPGQSTYTLKIFNSSKDSVSFDINCDQAGRLAPEESIAIPGSTPSVEPYRVSVNLNHNGMRHEITFAAIDKSAIDLHIRHSDSLHYNAGYSLYGLPFPDLEAEAIEEFSMQQTQFTKWVKTQYALVNNRSFSVAQKDSILEIVRSGRRHYLDTVRHLIRKHRKSLFAYYVFKSEFMLPKNILAIGKEKVISTFGILDPAQHATRVGHQVATFVDDVRSNTVGAIIKNFQFKSPDLKEYDLHEYIRGSKALLIFTARGCRACVEQIPIITDIQARHKDLKIVYVSLDVSVRDWESDRDASNYPGLMTVNLPPFNNAVNLQQLFMVEFIPQLFLIGEDLRILYDNLSPYQDDNLSRLRDRL